MKGKEEVHKRAESNTDTHLMPCVYHCVTYFSEPSSGTRCQLYSLIVVFYVKHIHGHWKRPDGWDITNQLPTTNANPEKLSQASVTQIRESNVTYSYTAVFVLEQNLLVEQNKTKKKTSCCSKPLNWIALLLNSHFTAMVTVIQMMYFCGITSVWDTKSEETETTYCQNTEGNLG